MSRRSSNRLGNSHESTPRSDHIRSMSDRVESPRSGCAFSPMIPVCWPRYQSSGVVSDPSVPQTVHSMQGCQWSQDCGLPSEWHRPYCGVLEAPYCGELRVFTVHYGNHGLGDTPPDWVSPIDSSCTARHTWALFGHGSRLSRDAR